MTPAVAKMDAAAWGFQHVAGLAAILDDELTLSALEIIVALTHVGIDSQGNGKSVTQSDIQLIQECVVSGRGQRRLL